MSVQKFQLGLNSISSLGGNGLDINPNSLTCALCCCICDEPKQCMNKKCGKNYCGECYKKNLLKNNNDKNFKCPFCTMTLGYREADEEIQNSINNLKFYCNKSVLCNKQYLLKDILQYHLHETIISHNCKACGKVISEKNPNYLKCNICYHFFCYQNVPNANFGESNIKVDKQCIKRCFTCHTGFCKNCNINIKNLKSDDINYICELCNEEKKCQICNQNNPIFACTFCKKFLCENCYLKNCKCNYIICKNDCLIEKASKCKNCSKYIKDLKARKEVHKEIYKCDLCYKKCELCKNHIGDIKCLKCSKTICIRSCSVRCKICKKLFCNECGLICSICKNIICEKCADYCSNCGIEISMISCKKCKSDTIRQCKFKGGCNRKLCINCWLVCNTCNKVFCEDHSYECMRCEQNFCDDHYFFCKKCSTDKDDEKYKKLCLKNCTLKCINCDNKINILCKKENHPKDFVETALCNHNVCFNCIKRCFKCNKDVVTCPKCINNFFYEKCNYCDKFLCSECCGKCNICDDDYCNLGHKCEGCGKVNNNCTKCIDMKKIKCGKCGSKNKNKNKNKLKICPDCKKIFLCSVECFIKLKNKGKRNHLCQMFICEEHMK